MTVEITNKKFAALLFLTALVQGILWALIIPPWQSPDEPSHFAYVQHVSEQGFFNLPGASAYVSAEVALSLDKLKFNKIDTFQASTFHLTTEDEQEARSFLEGAEQADRTRPGLVKNNAGMYPPLFYWIVSLGYKAAYHGTILERLYAVRIAGTLITAFEVLVMFFIARFIFGEDRISLFASCCLLLFQPMHAFMGSSANCGSLLGLVSITMIYLLLRMIRFGPCLGLQVGIVACVVAGLLTKPLFTAMLPLWLLAFLIAARKDGVLHRRNLPHLVFILAFLILMVLIYAHFGRKHIDHWMNAYEYGSSKESRSFFNYLGLTFSNLLRPWSTMGKRFLTFYWANLGYTLADFSFFGIYLCAHFVMIFSAVRVFVGIIRSPHPWHASENAPLSFALFGSILFFLGIVVLGYAIAHEAWGSGNLHGRYLFPTLSLHMILLTAGCIHLMKSKVVRKRVAAVLVGLMLLWQISSFALVVERFYL